MNDEALDDDQLALLRVLADAQRRVPKGGHEEFLTASSNDGVVVIAADGENHDLRQTDLSELEDRGLVEITTHRAHGDVNGFVTKRGFALVASGPPSSASGPARGPADGSTQSGARLLDLQRYLVGERIGLGVHGQVYAGTDPQMGGRRVALKFLNPSTEGGLGTAAQAAAQAKAQHPNVLPVFALGRSAHPDTGQEAACIVMELVEKATTLEHLLGGGLISREVGFRICREILDGLSAIHRHGLVHGDVHDGNVLLDGSGRVRIIDVHYIETLAQGSTATRASLVQQDCLKATTLFWSVMNKAGVAMDVIHAFQADGRRARDLAALGQALAVAENADGSQRVQLQATQPSHGSTRLQDLLDAGKLPAFTLVDSGSKRHDDTRTMDYSMKLQQLDQVPVLRAIAVTAEGLSVLGNLPGRREDGFRLPLSFGTDRNARGDVAVEVRLNSGDTVRYRFAVTAVWKGSSHSERVGLDLLRDDVVVETIDG